MRKPFYNMAKNVGQAPGSFIHIGEQKMENTIIRLIEYDDQGLCEEKSFPDLTHLPEILENPSIKWLNVIGLHQVQPIADIGKMVGIHALLIEDILNSQQRPKIETGEGILFLIIKMLHWDDANGRVEIEQLSLLLGRSFVITFQEQEKDVFDLLRQRIRDGNGRIKHRGADYLAYAILDSVVDAYFLILEKLADKIEQLEEELVTLPNTETLQKIYVLKHELLFVRKAIWPLRELLSRLQWDESSLIQDSTLIFLRDVNEHMVQIFESLEIFRDMVANMLEIYLSSISNKMNEVMKVLTVIATLFIPLTFVTSLYGMNFANMPELGWRWGYGYVWLLLLFMTAALLLYFRRKDWI